MNYDLETVAEISTPAFLTRDSNGTEWETNDMKLNGFLGHLPWWALDREIHQDCLLYQVGTKGALTLIQLIHVLKIKTKHSKYVISYKIDSRHAQIRMHRISTDQRFQVGLQAIHRQIPCR